MQQDALIQHSALTDHQILGPTELSFDLDAVSISGSYSDELSAYRARKGWAIALEASFLLEGKHDFTFEIHRGDGRTGRELTCKFLTACGRYAFWRLTNNQSPEAQYLIETAHLPAGSAEASWSAAELEVRTERSSLLMEGPAILPPLSARVQSAMAHRLIIWGRSLKRQFRTLSVKLRRAARKQRS